MSEPTILAEDQIITSDVMAIGSLRPDIAPIYRTYLPVVNVTLQLTNDDYAEPPQLGKVDILEDQSLYVAFYKVWAVFLPRQPIHIQDNCREE